MADFYQSEVSRLVLSFLVEENLVNSANTFQAESIHLSEVGIVSIPYYNLINFKEKKESTLIMDFSILL